MFFFGGGGDSFFIFFYKLNLIYNQFSPILLNLKFNGIRLHETLVSSLLAIHKLTVCKVFANGVCYTLWIESADEEMMKTEQLHQID